MKRKKQLKQILSCVVLAIVSLVIGYTILMPNEKTEGKDSPLAVYLETEGTYTQSIIKSFDEVLDEYDYDHIDCGNATENAKWSWNGEAFSATGLNAHTTCKVYFKQSTFSGLLITSITVDGSQASSVPTQMKYYVEPTCSGATASWNYASWSLDVSAINSKHANCSLAFTTITSSNLATKFGSQTNAASGKYLNVYIKSLLGSGTEVSSGTNGILKNEETSATGTYISPYYHDKGIRYEGANPNNYIKFNNELWRIIGIFRDTKVYTQLSSSDTYYAKIIRNESIGSYAYNTIANTTVSSSAYGWWSKSDGSVANLNYILNHYYMGADNDNYDGTSDATNCRFYYTSYSNVSRNCDFRVIGIQPGWRDMVKNTTWYTASLSNTAYSAAFTGERGSRQAAGGSVSYTDYSTKKYSKVGLMYLSDYLYSGSSSSPRWLLQNGYEWTISLYNSASTAINLNSSGNSQYKDAYYSGAVRPTVYLSANVYIIGGDGSIVNPYIINGV